MMGLRVVVMAGPNGSGKTSLIQSLIDDSLGTGLSHEMPATVLNPDEWRKRPDLAEHARPGEDLDRTVQRLISAHRAELIERKESFAFETVMSHPSKLGELAALRRGGYFVNLAFITTNNSDINVARVAYRVRTGTTTGHDVPEDRVRARYERTLALLPAAIELADRSILFDNSRDRRPWTRQAVIDVDRSTEPASFRVELERQGVEQWVEATLTSLQRRYDDRGDLRDRAGQLGYNVEFADQERGRYRGPLVGLGTDYFGTVLSTPERPTLVVHDLAYFMPTPRAHIEAEIRASRNPTIELQYANGREPAYSVEPVAGDRLEPGHSVSRRPSGRER